MAGSLSCLLGDLRVAEVFAEHYSRLLLHRGPPGQRTWQKKPVPKRQRGTKWHEIEGKLDKQQGSSTSEARKPSATGNDAEKMSLTWTSQTN